jgi:hypothetical protein
MAGNENLKVSIHSIAEFNLTQPFCAGSKAVFIVVNPVIAGGYGPLLVSRSWSCVLVLQRKYGLKLWLLG